MAQQIFFVDDDPAICKTVSRILRRKKWSVLDFLSAQDCLKALKESPCDLLITDVNMPEMTGIELLKKVRRTYPAIPILIVTGFPEIPLAVRAIKAGALDYIEKPLDRDYLLKTVSATLKPRDKENPLAGRPLTPTENKVLKMIAQGQTNREIANSMERSIRTIEDHRAHIMKKLNAQNLAELIKIAVQMDLE